MATLTGRTGSALGGDRSQGHSLAADPPCHADVLRRVADQGGAMSETAGLLLLLSVAAQVSNGQPVKIAVARGTAPEEATKARLEQVLGSHDLAKYTFTREVVIEEGARNHALPVLTLHAGFVDSDDLLASYVHEQIHWHLREHDIRQRRAVAELRRMYPGAPVGLPDGAESAYSTYGHLVTCYLELQAIRTLLGRERAAGVITRKRHYLWIYATVLSDETKIGGLVRAHGLAIE
ncbi:MAG: hypothetical protein H6Q86_1528 [candidate division NC10 bacterium]|nr:hypothetical protein [candidate division NC10 bacterium]